MDSNEIWDICVTYAQHYTWPEDPEPPAPSEKSGKSKKSKKEKPKPKPLPVVEVKPSPFCVIAKIVDTRGESCGLSDDAPQLPPCRSHLFLLNQIRDVPFDKPEYKPDLARWKRFRWVHWARMQGLYSDEGSPLRFLQIVDFFMNIESEPDSRNPSRTKAEEGTRLYLDNGDDSSEIERRKTQLKRHTNSDIIMRSHRRRSASATREDNTSIDTMVTNPETQNDPTLWVDFYQFSKYIDNMYIFFKPSMMHSHLKITDVQEKRPQVPKSTKDHKEKRIIWPYHLKLYSNEPLYFFLDTMDPKMLIISFSHTGNRAILEQKCLVVHCNLTSLWQKKFTFSDRCNLQTHGNIVMEKYDWETETFGDHVLEVNTTGNKSVSISLDAGRQVMRLWITSVSSYHITLLSDVDVEVGPLEFILDKMQLESERFLQFCLDHGTAFGNVIQAFGTPEFPGVLRQFYQSFYPNIQGVTKKGIEELQQGLLELYGGLVKQKNPECGEVIYCLRVLFLNPSLGKDLHCPPQKPIKSKEKKVNPKIIKIESPPQWDDDECLSPESSRSKSSKSSGDDLKKEAEMYWAACKIQAFFKMIYVKKLKQCHDKDHPRFNKVYEVLKTFYKNFLNVDKRFEFLPGLFRRLLMIPNEGALLSYYPWCDDLGSVINNQIINGSVTISNEGYQWVPIGRFAFFIDSPFEESVKIVLFTNIEQFVVRVFNNDTLEEVFRGVNCACVAGYTCNAKGYTLLGYGWSTEQKTYFYKYNFITMKRFDKYSLIIEEEERGRLCLTQGYHHNKKGIITQVALGITNDVSLTLKLRCSYDQVLVKLRCLTKEGKLVQEITGKGNIILPVLNLTYIKEEPVEVAPKLSKVKTFKTSRKSLTSVSLVNLKKKSSSVPDRDKRSRTGSLTSRRSNQSKKSSLKADPKCFYYLEALVLKNSWPLTKEEWKQSDKLTKKTPSKSSLKSKTKLGDYDSLPNPKWSLELLCNEEDEVQFTVDQRRSKEMKNNKSKWFEGDPHRLEKGKKLRETFLKEIIQEVSESDTKLQIEEYEYLYNESFYEEIEEDKTGNISEPSRTLVHPDSTSKTRIPLDYNLYTQSSTLSDYASTLMTRKESIEDNTSYISKTSSNGSYVPGKKCYDFLEDTEDG